ncbi:MAG: hypothetical protein AAF892_10860 [Cyanobacteria bacterium P01_D01_bin.71]
MALRGAVLESYHGKAIAYHLPQKMLAFSDRAAVCDQPASPASVV